MVGRIYTTKLGREEERCDAKTPLLPLLLVPLLLLLYLLLIPLLMLDDWGKYHDWITNTPTSTIMTTNRIPHNNEHDLMHHHTLQVFLQPGSLLWCAADNPQCAMLPSTDYSAAATDAFPSADSNTLPGGKTPSYYWSWPPTTSTAHIDGWGRTRWSCGSCKRIHENIA